MKLRCLEWDFLNILFEFVTIFIHIVLFNVDKTEFGLDVRNSDFLLL